MQINKKLLFMCAAASLLHTLPAQAVIEENGPTYTHYPLNTATIPVLSATGSKSTDPVFGTDIMRLTDSSDGSTSCLNSYSYWPVFNKDSTRIAVRCRYASSPTSRTVFYDLNASAFTVSYHAAVAGLSTDMVWSASDPNVVFTRAGTGGGAFYGRTLNTYNVSTGVTTLVKDFTSYIPVNYGLNQMSHSMDDDIWAFTIVDDAAVPVTPENKKFVGYLVWKRSTDTVLLNATFSSPYLGNDGLAERVDEVQIDKTGRYLTINGSGNYTQVRDLQTGAFTQLVKGLDAYVHEDTGNGAVLSGCGTAPGICYRPLSRPQTAPTILPFSNWNQANLHFSMLADNQGWGLAVNAHKDYVTTLPFHGEIFQVATDGSGRVRRIAHTNSSAHTYDQEAFGNISRDGRFIAWTSDWGGHPGSTRTDVYLAKIDPAPKRPSPISGPVKTLNMSLASNDGTHAALIQQSFGTPADASATPTQSVLRVFEDSVELKPPHSAHADIRSLGDGRFSHWLSSGGIETLRFSASDSTTTTPASHPLTNGRTYRYNVPDEQLPLTTAGGYVDLPNVTPAPAPGQPGSYACLLTVSLGHLADTTTYRVQSTLRVFENGVELSPGHSLHTDIRYLGAGRFSHQITGSTETLRLSASDTTNPCTNGRSYTYIIDSRLP